MKQRINLMIEYMSFWLLIFLFSKLIFILLLNIEASNITFRDFLNIFFNGFKLDLSAVAYLSIFPFLILLFDIIYFSKIWKYLFLFFTIVFIIVHALLQTGDLFLYPIWGFKIDATVLTYLSSPTAAMASISGSMWAKGLLFIACFIVMPIWYFQRRFLQIWSTFKPVKRYMSLVMLLCIGVLIIPIRGGVGTIPLNVSSVYFHSNQFYNHAAINTLWNFLYTISEKDKLDKKFNFFDSKYAHNQFDALFVNTDTIHLPTIPPKSNILLIAMESMSSKIIARKDVTPYFNTLMKEGIYFSNCYSSGDRTDKALVALLCGYPPLPQTNIINYPSKSQKLPFLSTFLKEMGYKTGFYYGGDINFANYRSLLVTAQTDFFVTESDFSDKEKNSKWGAHDHFVFNKLLADLDTLHNPFFVTMFTLSCHEPFEVPADQFIQGSIADSLFLNAAHYADKSLGDFIQKAKTKVWWKNTMVILVADHGTVTPWNTEVWNPVKYHIPLLILGGVVPTKDTVYQHTTSQADIPYTILQLLNNQGYKKFTFSKNLFDVRNNFAFFTYNNGLGLVKDGSELIYDNAANKLLLNTNSDTNLIDVGKSFLQVLSEDFQTK